MNLDLAEVMQVVLAVVLVCLGLLLLFVIGHRLLSGLVDSRRSALAQRVRPLLLEVLSDDDPEPAALSALSTLPDKQWRVLEPTVVTMLGKVRGAARNSLVDVLDRRGTIDRAVTGTRSRSWVRRCEAAEMLGAVRQPAGVPALVALLRDRHPEVRQVSARALGRVGDKDAVNPLSAAVVSNRSLPMRDVASALVLLEPDATPAIVAAAEGPEARVRSLAAEVLGLRGAVEAGDLLGALLTADPATEVRIRAARALGRIGVRSAVVPLVAALESSSPELRAVAARALGQIGAPDAVAPLLRCLTDPWHRVRSNAAESLATLGPPGLAALNGVVEADDPGAGYAEQVLAVHAVTQQPLDRSGS